MSASSVAPPEHQAASHLPGNRSERYALMEYEEIKRNVRHRYPFLLLDRVLKLTANSVVAVKNVTGTDRCLEGHFPDDAILPGVLLIEAMAQAGGLLFLKSSAAGRPTYLAKVDRMKFKQMVRPGDQVILRATDPVMLGSTARVSVSASVDDREVSCGEITYYFGGNTSIPADVGAAERGQ